MTQENPFAYTPERQADAERDMLAIFAAALADDDEGALAVWRNARQFALLPVALGYLADVL
jgi:hypothetical protein